MNHAMRSIITVAVVAAISIVTACAKPPQARMDGLVDAMEKAEIAEASTYAPAEFEAAREAATDGPCRGRGPEPTVRLDEVIRDGSRAVGQGERRRRECASGFGGQP